MRVEILNKTVKKSCMEMLYRGDNINIYEKTIRTLLILASVVILAGACTKKAAENTQHSSSIQSTQSETAETTTVTDHAGNIVEIPVNPQRIASLYTMTTTAMLIDLQVPIIGTATRTKMPENKPYIRYAEEIFGIKFEDTNYFNYGKKGKDLEQIKISKPDLIVGTINLHAKVYKRLSAIAPTILIDAFSADLFAVYRDLATWVNKRDYFDSQLSRYKNRLTEVKDTFTKDPGEQTLVYFHPLINKGKIYVAQHYGALTKVAHDLGFKRPDFIKQNFPDNKVHDILSAEIINELNADYIVSTYQNQLGETEETVSEAFDRIAPGWRDFLKAYRNDTFITLNREIAYPTCFKSYDYVLDQFEKYAH